MQQRDIRETKALLVKLANHPELNAPVSNVCPNILNYALELTPRIANIGIVSPEGNVLCTILSGSKPINISDRAYFQEVNKTKKFTVGQFQHDRSINKATVNFKRVYRKILEVIKCRIARPKVVDSNMHPFFLEAVQRAHGQITVAQ